MSISFIESKAAELAQFQDALDAAHLRGPGSYGVLFDSPPEGLSVHEIDTERVLVRVSAAHERLLGYTPEGMTGRPVSSFVVLKEVSETAMSRKLSGGGALEPYARAFVRADGSGVTMLQLDRHLRDAAGKVTGIRTVLTLLPSAPATGTWPRPPLPPGGPAGGPAARS